MRFPEFMNISILITCNIILATLLSAAGCITQPNAENQMSNISVAGTSAPTVMMTTLVTAVPTTCPQPVNRSYWIKINPISNVSAGDSVFINGTTNLPAGMTLEVDIDEYWFRALPHYQPPHASGTVKIRKTDGCVNTFSLLFNTTGFGGRDQISVEVYSLDFNVSGLSGYDFPANLSEFYITSQVNP